MKNLLIALFTLISLTAFAQTTEPDSVRTIYTLQKDGGLVQSTITFYHDRRVIDEVVVKDTLTTVKIKTALIARNLADYARDLSTISGHEKLIGEQMVAAWELRKQFPNVGPMLDTTGLKVFLSSSFKFKDDKRFTADFSFKVNKESSPAITMAYDKSTNLAIYTPYILRIKNWDGREVIDFWPSNESTQTEIVWKSLKGYTIIQTLK
jgi:hypothetical protein